MDVLTPPDGLYRIHRWFHEFSVITNLQIFQKTEFVYLFLCTVNVSITFIFSEKVRRFVVTEFGKLSDEFDNSVHRK